MTMITPSYLGETIEYSSLHACRSTLEDPTNIAQVSGQSCGQAPRTTVFAESVLVAACVRGIVDDSSWARVGQPVLGNHVQPDPRES